MAVSQGQQANLNGHIVEAMLIPLFAGNGFTIIQQSELSKLGDEFAAQTDRYAERIFEER